MGAGQVRAYTSSIVERSAISSKGITVERGRIGPPETDSLFIDPSANEIWRGLVGWQWLNLECLSATAVSAFGDVFFSAPDGSIQMLDTRDGRLIDVAVNLAEIRKRLQNADERERLLLESVLTEARYGGLTLEKDECYDFVIPPAFGGEISSRALVKMPFASKLHIAGRMYQELRQSLALKR